MFLGELDFETQSLRDILAPLRRNLPQVQVAFVYGNHLGLHGQVQDLDGVRVAELAVIDLPIPPLWRPDQVNEIQSVTTQEAKQMTRRLAREEGIFGGTSSGANVATIICDSGLRYLSTDVYREPA